MSEQQQEKSNDIVKAPDIKGITDLATFLSDLRGGVFIQKAGRALSECALAAVTHGRQSQVTLKFDIKRIGESSQVVISHTIALSMPTKTGKVAEDDTTQTPMHVGFGGKLSLFAGDQLRIFDDNK